MHECLHAGFGCTHAACIRLHACPSACGAKRIAVRQPSHTDWRIGIAAIAAERSQPVRFVHAADVQAALYLAGHPPRAGAKVFRE